MFEPKHTVESVAKELVVGLEDGSIVLREEIKPEPDWWEIEGIKCTIALEKRPFY